MTKQVALRRLGVTCAVIGLGALGGISATALGSDGSVPGGSTTITTGTTGTTSTDDWACPRLRKTYACRVPGPTTTTNPK